MPKYSKTAVLAYALAAVVLSVYGVQVCPYIEGLGYTGVLPVFLVGFSIAFAVRWALLRGAGTTPERLLWIELSVWGVSALIVTMIDSLAYGFPVGSGAKVLVGTLAIALPASTYQALLAERDTVLEARQGNQRRFPSGPELRMSTRLLGFVDLGVTYTPQASITQARSSASMLQCVVPPHPCCSSWLCSSHCFRVVMLSARWTTTTPLAMTTTPQAMTTLLAMTTTRPAMMTTR